MRNVLGSVCLIFVKIVLVETSSVGEVAVYTVPIRLEVGRRSSEKKKQYQEPPISLTIIFFVDTS